MHFSKSFVTFHISSHAKILLAKCNNLRNKFTYFNLIENI